MKIWWLFYTLWTENRRRKKFSFLKGIKKSNVIKKIRVLVFSIRIWYLAYPTDRSLVTNRVWNIQFSIINKYQVKWSEGEFVRLEKRKTKKQEMWTKYFVMAHHLNLEARPFKFLLYLWLSGNNKMISTFYSSFNQWHQKVLKFQLVWCSVIGRVDYKEWVNTVERFRDSCQWGPLTV